MLTQNIQIFQSSRDSLTGILEYQTKTGIVSTSFKFEKDDIINFLFSEMKNLRLRLDNLQKKQQFVTDASLISLWDNPYDDVWNEL